MSPAGPFHEGGARSALGPSKGKADGHVHLHGPGDHQGRYKPLGQIEGGKPRQGGPEAQESQDQGHDAEGSRCPFRLCR